MSIIAAPDIRLEQVYGELHAQNGPVQGMRIVVVVVVI